MTHPGTTEGFVWPKATSETLDRYGPIVGAALYAAGVRQQVSLHGIMAVFIDWRRMAGFEAMTWSELCGLVVEARGLYNLHVRGYEGRARNLKLGMLNAYPQPHAALMEAVADDTLAELAGRI